MQFKDLIKELQEKMNAHGERLTVDGDPGNLTKNALMKYHVDLVVKPELVLDTPPISISPSRKDWFGAPWVGANIDLLGLYETDKALIQRYEPEWAKEGFPSWRGLAGSERAWCILRGNADRRKVGAKQSNDPAAASGSKDYWSKKCPFWFGCGLDIEHIGKDGGVTGRHWADFLYWIDEPKRLCATLDGNRGNRFAVNITNLSGKPGADRLKNGPRWSNDWPDGQIVSMNDVLAKYPMLKISGNGSTTTR